MGLRFGIGFASGGRIGQPVTRTLVCIRALRGALWAPCRKDVKRSGFSRATGGGRIEMPVTRVFAE
jgi:hypothetical protein